MGSTDEYCDLIHAHYVSCWHADCDIIRFEKGPVSELPANFRVLRFPPSEERRMWTYATLCMSQPAESERLELHMFSSAADDGIIELLVATAHYHRTGARLHLHDTINFGRPWIGRSICTHALVSLPYLDGPSLEWVETNVGATRFLWLIPITRSEVMFARENGTDALEERFEAAHFDYLDPLRSPVV